MVLIRKIIKPKNVCRSMHRFQMTCIVGAEEAYGGQCSHGVWLMPAVFILIVCHLVHLEGSQVKGLS